MSWSEGAILVIVVAIVLPWVWAELSAVRAMRRRRRFRQAYQRYVEFINESGDAWKR